MNIRWMIRRDLPDVVEIMRDTNPSHAWSENDFIRKLRQRNCIGMVVENSDKEVVAFMVYLLTKPALELINFAVTNESQRKGVGALMLDALKNKLSVARRCSIIVSVSERLVESQKFFAAQGFRAVKFVSSMTGDGEVKMQFDRPTTGEEIWDTALLSQVRDEPKKTR